MSSFQWGSSLIPELDVVEHFEGDGSGTDDEDTLPITSPPLSDDESCRQSRLAAYQEILLGMFGSSFECVPINGGFSGSSVVRIAPFDSAGNREESVIVKLDKGNNIRLEVANSLQAHRALGDAAARILDVPIFLHRDGVEYGAFKMELAGACWHIPEFVGASMINTFRDIAVFEGEEQLLEAVGFCQPAERPYGSVDRIVKELFGQDKGPTRSLRRYEETPEGGDRRISKSSNQLTGAELLISRLPLQIFVSDEILNFFVKSEKSVTLSIQSVLSSVRSALQLLSPEWKIMRGFAHGDLNGSNILIDSMDGMWLIDFANSYKLPLSSDLAKFETCFLFEYCVIPIPVHLLRELPASIERLSEWFRVPEHVMASFLTELKSIDLFGSDSLFELIERHCRSDPKSAHRLHARLYVAERDQASFDQLLLSVADIVCENLVPRSGVPKEVKTIRYTESFVYGISHVLRMREFFFDDIRKSVWAQTSELFNYDVSNVELCVLLIREVARIIKFQDVPPWIKFVAARYLERLGATVISEIDRLGPLELHVDSVFATAVAAAPAFLETTEKAKYFKHVVTCFGHITDIISGKQMDVMTQCVQCRVRRLDTGELLDEELSESYVLQGIGGAGKTCFLRRLAITQIQSGDLVPIFVPVSELISCGGNFFGWLEFSFDRARFEFLRSTVHSGTALVLVDGIDESNASSLTAVLQMIHSLKVQVIATCKQWRSEFTGLAPIEICPLDRDQRSFIVHVRSGETASEKFEPFFDSFCETNDVEFVKSPGFLSLLICYWLNVHAPPPDSAPPFSLELHRQITEPTDVLAYRSASVSDVYRVAVSVLVHRYLIQSEETDRLLLRESTKRIMHLLRLIALKAKLDNKTEFTSLFVFSAIPPDLQLLWERIAEDIHKFPLLTVTDSTFKFTMGGIQDFLAAEGIIHYDEFLVPLRSVLANPEWAGILTILAEKAPTKYIALIEADIENMSSPETVLHVGARQGCVSLFKLLKQKPAMIDSLINVPDTQSMFPLHVAAKNGNATICRLLIEANADPWQTTNLGWCPLHFAASSHNREVCSVLLPSVSHPLPVLANAGLDLGRCILEQSISSVEFLDRVKLVFPELSYFRGRSDTTPDASASVTLEPSEIELRRTLSAMLCVFYVCADRYDEFVEKQDPDKLLSLSSWTRIRNWALNKVKLTTPEAVDAMLSLMAVHDLGKLKDFRNDLAPDYKDHDAAMKYILQTTPEVLPSLCRLGEEYQYLVRTTLTLDFNFGQFLQAENLPANLAPIGELIGSRGAKGLAFYLFHIFADMAGIMGAVSLSGSLFMTETMYSNFARGMESLSLLAVNSPDEVYDHFLETRARNQGMSDLSDFRRRALIRLACLCRIFDPVEGNKLLLAYAEVSASVKTVLEDHLNRDGRGAFLIYYAPAFMENCKLNPLVGLRKALEFLSRIFVAADSIAWNSTGVVTIHIAEAAELAKRATAESMLDDSVCFRIEPSSGLRGHTEGTLRISPWRCKGFSVSCDSYVELEYYDHDYTSANKRCVLGSQILTCLLTSVGNDEEYVLFRQQIGNRSDRLSLRSWRQLFGLVNNVPALRTLIAIADIGLIQRLRDDLQISKELSSNEARSVILAEHTYAVPSFERLSAECQSIVEICLADLSNISISRIIVAEEEVLALPRGSHYDLFFLVSILLSPSVLLTESGFHATMFLKTLMQRDHISCTSVQEEYYKYRLRLGGGGSLVKLICLCSVFSPSGGTALLHAWNKLSQSQQDFISKLIQGKHLVGLSEVLTNSRRGCLEDALVALLDLPN